MSGERQKVGNIARRVSLLGMLFGLAVVLSFVEGMLPALPALPPGVKLGLSNIVTMFTLLMLGGKSAFTIALLKALFVLLTRGGVAAVLSLAGGTVSVGVMLLILVCVPALHPTVLSAVGAVMHNVGQLCLAALILQNTLTFAYLPVMILSGVGMGLLTGFLLMVLRPHLKRLGYFVLNRYAG